MNISVKSLSNIEIKASFKIVMRSSFQNCLWFLYFVENWLKYTRLKTMPKIRKDTVTFSCGCSCSSSSNCTRSWCGDCGIDQRWRWGDMRRHAAWLPLIKCDLLRLLMMSCAHVIYCKNFVCYHLLHYEDFSCELIILHSSAEEFVAVRIFW